MFCPYFFWLQGFCFDLSQNAFDDFAVKALRFQKRSEDWRDPLPAGEQVFRLGFSRESGASTLLTLNSFVEGLLGAIDTDACEKAASFLVLCDSFNIPVVLLVDTPGFLIGIDAERRRAPGKIMTFMQALQLCTVPKLSVILGKTYGQAYLNMGGGRNSDEVAAWLVDAGTRREAEDALARCAFFESHPPHRIQP